MTMKFKRRSRGYGFGLVEALIVAGAVALAAAGVYKFYSTVEAKERSHQESQNLLQVTNNVLRAYSAMPNFSAVSNASLVTENLLPSGMDVAGNASNPIIGSVFGATLSVSSTTLDGRSNSGLVLTYTGVPRKNCAQFIANAAAGHNFRDINVNNQPVLGTNRVLDQAQVISRCASQPSSTVTFTVQHGVQGASTILSPGACVVPTPASETQTVGCPTGYAGAITQTRTASCPAGAALPVWSAWSVVSNTCVQVCVPDPSSPQTRTSTPCPAGQYGTITERRVSACATGQTTGAPTWSAWVVVSNTCAPQCVVPADQTRSPGCPAGQSGVFTERRSATCPSPTGAPVWGPWVTLTNTCAQNCVLPTPNPETRWVQTSGNCDSGYSGTKYWEVEQRRTASCPSTTGSPVYTSWTNTGNKRNENTSQCAALCRPEENLERWVPKEEGCGPGYAGSRRWEARETRTSHCPANATYPVTSQWTPTGETRNLVNECEAAACQVRGGTRFTWRQPGNQYDCVGEVPADIRVASGDSLTVDGSAQVNTSGVNFRAAGRVQYACQAGSLSVHPTNPTCAPAACNVASSALATWGTSSSVMCEATYSTANPGGGTSFSVPVGNSFTVRDQIGNVQGSMTLLCAQTQSANMGQVATVQETASRSCAGSCANTPQPAPNVRQFAGCAAGFYGTWQQQDIYEAAAFPQCWANTLVQWLPAGAPTGACKTCPATTRETQWGTTTNGTCAAGQYGSTNREKEQARNKSYVCPANTATLPAPTYTAWTDTGNTRVTVNNCANCPSPVVERQWVTSSATATCPAGQAGTIGREVEQSRTKSYSCPAGTLTLPSADYTAWTNTGNARATVNNCVVCPAPETEVETQWVTTSASSCSAGQYGQIGRQKEQRRTRIKSYSCPAGTATMPSPTYSGWSSWTDTGNVRNTTGGNTCTACPATTTEKQWVGTANGTCAAGSWGYTSREKEQQRTKSYNCPAGTVTLPSATYTAWTDTGNTRQTSASCTACPAATTETGTQWVSTTNGSCSAGQWGVVGREKEQSRTRSVSYSCPAGTTSLPAPTYGSWSGWTDTGNVRNKSGGSTCTACPANSTRTVTRWVAHTNGSCSAGQYGTVAREKEQRATETTSYSCPAGTTTLPNPSVSTGSWADTGTTRNTGGSCAACPGATTETQWDNRSQACPSGYTGSHTWQAEQRRTKSYSCPAGTVSLPSPSYSGWADTGAKRNESNTCAPACTPWNETVTEYRINNTCTNGRTRACEPGEDRRTATYRNLCPSGRELVSATGWVQIIAPFCPPKNQACP